MPTYEYRCRACGHEFERFQKISEAPLKTCPKCGKHRVERLISAGGGLLFRGPGFYATDYRKGAPGGAESGEKGSREKESGEKESGDKTTPKKKDARDGRKTPSGGGGGSGGAGDA